MKKKIVCIIQARTTSKRLPNKIFLDLEGKPVLSRVIERLSLSKYIDKIVIATPDTKDNDSIEKFLEKDYKDVGIYRGKEDDVLDRYYQAGLKFNADVVVRITSDCPFIDPIVVDKVISKFLEDQADYTSNIEPPRTYPRGLDTEVMSFSALKEVWEKAESSDDREHVTLYIRKNPELFNTNGVINDEDLSEYRLTIDEEDDYKLAIEIYKKLNGNKLFHLDDIISLLKEDSNLVLINKEVLQKNNSY